MKQRPQLYMYYLRFYSLPVNGYTGRMYYLSTSPTQFVEDPLSTPWPDYFRVGHSALFKSSPSWFKYKVDLQLAAIKMGFQVKDMTKQQEYV